MLSILLYALAISLLIYIVVHVIKQRKLDLEGAFAALGIVVSIILAVRTNSPPSPVTVADATVIPVAASQLALTGAFESSSQASADQTPTNSIEQTQITESPSPTYTSVPTETPTSVPPTATLTPVPPPTQTPSPSPTVAPFIDTFDGPLRTEWIIIPPGVGTSNGLARPAQHGLIVYTPPYSDYRMNTKVQGFFEVYVRTKVKDNKLLRGYVFACYPESCSWYKRTGSERPSTIYPLIYAERTFPPEKLLDLIVDVQGRNITATIGEFQLSITDEEFTDGGIGIAALPYIGHREGTDPILTQFDMVEVHPLP